MQGTVNRLNKTALVTGASSGIGRAVAVKLADEGYNLIVTARRMDLLEALVAELEGKGRRAEAYPCDLSSGDAREALLEYVKNTYGCPDLVVNNAGFAWYGYFAEMDWHTADEMMGVNNAAAVHLTLAFLPGMLARGEGTIVNVASQAGRHGMPFLAVYDATKGGLISFSEGLRRELDGTGVRVVVVLPGYTETDMVSELTDVYREIRLGKLVSPHDVARQTVDALLTGQPEVHVGTLESFGGYASVLAPRLADLYWRVFAPRQTLEAAARRQAEKYRAG